MRGRGLVAVVLCASALGSLAILPGSAAAASSEKVSGNADSPACLPTGADAYDPVSSDFSCSGGATWTGTWTGETVFRASGTTDLVTGDTKGTIEERLFGRTADGHMGELHLGETFTLDGATDQEKITATILDGSGDFAGATGTIYFTAVEVSAGPALGTYSGSWTHPAYGSTPSATGEAPARSGSSSGSPAAKLAAGSRSTSRTRHRRGRHYRRARREHSARHSRH